MFDQFAQYVIWQKVEPHTAQFLNDKAGHLKHCGASGIIGDPAAVRHRTNWRPQFITTRIQEFDKHTCNEMQRALAHYKIRCCIVAQILAERPVPAELHAELSKGSSASPRTASR
eukprot:6175675-Pyramimonas_sp.AAC.1